MKLINRKHHTIFLQELFQEKEMIFLAGPKQVGKTTLTKDLAKKYKNTVYFNWDILSNKKTLIKNPTFFQSINRKDSSRPLVILDEIHKYKKWKNYLKGIYDEFSTDFLFLILGSGRLNTYQKGGDSLAGRYLMSSLFPLTISELSRKKRTLKNFFIDPLADFKTNNSLTTKKTWEKLSNLSGFPEPFSKNKKSFWQKWSRNYGSQIIREDIRDISNIKNINDVEILFSLLPSKVGSTISINNLAGDISVAPDTVKSWLDLFETTYLIFKISPWTSKISRAISKEKKIYLFNYPLIQDKGALFENMVALELYKIIHQWNENGNGNFSLHFLRNKDKEEVDFLISDNRKPIIMIETKLSDTKPSKALLNFQEKLQIPALQLVNKDGVYQTYQNKKNKVLITTAHEWLASLPNS